MVNKIIFSLFFLVVFVGGGLIGILFHEWSYRTTATNTLKKNQPTPQLNGIDLVASLC